MLIDPKILLRRAVSNKEKEWLRILDCSTNRGGIFWLRRAGIRPGDLQVGIFSLQCRCSLLCNSWRCAQEENGDFFRE
jgi:hypothetical protein